MVLAAALLVTACATTPHRVAPQFETRLSAIRTVALLPPSVKVYELSAGGTREQMDEWSETARHNVVAAISKQLTARGPLAIKPFEPEPGSPLEEEFRDVRALYEAVSASVITHTYVPETSFPTKQERFEYSLGPLPEFAEAAKTDALLFVYAEDHISSGGRVALNVFTMLIGMAGGVLIIPPGGATRITAALVDAKSGDVLWFNARASQGGHDLRNPASAASLVADTFAALAKDTAPGTGGSPARR
jgi:hypothetical protein